MTDSSEYVPPKVWTWNKPSGGTFASINRPIAGPTHEKELPVGRHPVQLYSMGTPNGVKVTVMLEELLALGHHDAEYDAWLIKINEGDQFSTGFVAVNPHSGIRVGFDTVVSRREVWRFSANRRCGSRGMSVMAVLANGQRAVPRWRIRPFLRLCAHQD
jgi:hypothetical protein